MQSMMTKRNNPENPVRLPTLFASAERIPANQLIDFADTCLNNPIVKVVLQSVEGIVLILNQHRQILASNQEVIQMLGLKEPNCIIGLRPGELFSCIHAMEGPGGCGTSMHCTTCGAANVILTSQDTCLPATNECMLSINRNGTVEAAEFVVRASPLHLGDQELTILVLQDISAIKRKDALEKIFFHDIINILSELKGWSEMLLGSIQDGDGAAQHIARIANRLSDEILGQRLVLQAEKGELTPAFMPVAVTEILADLADTFSRSSVGEGRILEIAPQELPSNIKTDKNLLMRVLINMVKNALEASEHGGTVRVWFAAEDGSPGFFVHNAGVIPDAIQLQIFKRSFSTKSLLGRGLGTYCMKLFGERYLQGKVSFTSAPSTGTTFSIILPAEEAAFSGEAATRPLLFDQPETIPGEELRNLPVKLACSLLQAARTADIDTLQLLIDKAAPYLPQATELLRDHLHRFDYQAISDMFQPYATPVDEEAYKPLPTKEGLLVVDGDPDMLLLLMGLLKEDHHQVRPVTSGSMALATAACLPPELILLDVHTPDMDGYELCRKFKESEPLRNVPIIFLSAVDEAFDKVRAFRCGAVDYIAKPFQIEELRARIATHLKLRKYALELKSANRELEAFSYSASHDLKAPVRQIQGFISVIRESCFELLNEEGKDSLQRIQRISARMNELIDDLLLFSRVGSAEVNRKPVDLSALATEITEALRKAEPERDVSITIAEGMSLEADPHLLRVMMENLINNAWKYTGKTVGARIDIGVQNENGEAIYFVRDNGAGFDMAYSDKLFRVFERLHDSSQFEGTGVGLSTVRRIVDCHGGRIWARGEEGAGAEFRFCL
jgi:signal transduction histidine kinase